MSRLDTTVHIDACVLKHANMCLQGGMSQVSTDPRLAELDMLQLGVQQLLSAYNATLVLCKPLWQHCSGLLCLHFCSPAPRRCFHIMLVTLQIMPHVKVTLWVMSSYACSRLHG